MLRFFSRIHAVVLCLFTVSQLAVLSAAQSAPPVALPYTMTTLAGLSPMTAAANTQCPNLPTGVKSADAFGDGCLAVNGIFGVAGRGGVVVDPFGNVFVADDVNKVVHMINPTSGIMTKAAGGGTACASKVDEFGDGCPVAQTSFSATSALRGIGIDPYGNVLLAGYNTNGIHILCRAASPLCVSVTPSPTTANPIQVQIGNMGLVAGCMSATTGVAGAAGVGLDNTPGFSTASNPVTGFANSGTCSTSLGDTDAPRGAWADVYGNVYYGDTTSVHYRVVLGPQTSSYFSGTNPLWTALALNASWPTLHAGYVYTFASGGVAGTTAGNSCAGGGTAIDAHGDGCLFTAASILNNTGDTQGVAADAAGNVVFTDPGNGLLRVLFASGAGTAGAAMVNAIKVNNPTMSPSTPQTGFVYALAGGGTTGGISTTPNLGNSRTALDASIFKLAFGPQGNLYIGDGTRVLFFDINTGYIRILFTGSANVTAGNFCSGTSGQKSLSAYSDACPASKSLFSNSNGLGVTVDGQGNLYLYDSSSVSTTGMLVRKVLAQGLAEQTAGTPLTQTFQVHLPETATGTATGATATLTSTPDMAAAAPVCAQNADNSVDCTVAVTATPTAAGLRSAGMTVALPAGSWENSLANVSLGGTVTGSVLAFDNASTTVSSVTTPIAPATNTLLSGIAPAAVALDGAANLYAIDQNTGSIVESVQGAAGVEISATIPVTPGQIAVGQQGDVFAVGSGTSTIEELKVSGAPASAGAPASFAAASQIAYTTVNAGTPAPQAIAVDTAGNLFVADNQGSSANNAVYRISIQPDAAQSQVTVATGFTNPVSLAVDNSGNVYVADKGAGAVYKLAPGVTGSYTQTTILSSVTPVAVAVDPAGDVYVQDLLSASVLEVPASGPSTITILSGLSNPVGLAVDGKGNVYSADAHNLGITQVVRGAVSYDFGTSEATTFAGTLSNVGNQASTGQNTATSNTTNFAVTAGPSNGCTISSNVVGAVAAGAACTLEAQLTGNGTTTVDDYIEYLPSASAVGVLTLQGTLLGVSYPTTTTIGSPSGTQTYAPSGTEVSFTVTVSAGTAPSAPTGSVNVYVDSTSAYTQYPLVVGAGTSSTATITLSGLTAGNHTIAAVYPTTGQFTGSGSSGTTTPFSIAQAATSVSWTPGSSSQPVSQALGTGVLNAAATPAIPGNFVYTATPSGGSAATVDASSYLPIGSYSLAVTFYPTDSVDYTSSTASVPSFVVTKADAIALAGASTNVVAADGSGNYTSLSSALAALPTTGGTIYIKPGTYFGQNAISYPNVALRGLGGDPTQVVLTAEDGAFSAPFVYPGSGAGNASASGDQGSSTLDVTKSAYIGNQQTPGAVTYTPNNFFAEYLTIQNTYNTDTVNTSTYNTTSGSCANSGPSQTLQALYNSGKQCNSQALALWIESDQAVLNNVNLASQQDTLFAGSQGCGSTCTAARQYMWQGTITGDVDYVFGDSALVFDHTNFFTTWHGSTATGTETIEAQNKKFQTGSASDYLSGYVCNVCTLLSQSTGMTNLYYGRPYGAYSTWIMLNSYVDQVNPVGWIEFSGDTNLPTSTYAEFNTQTYTDPAVGTSPYPTGLFFENSTSIPGYTGTPGFTLAPTGGNVGAGVTGTRETTSQDPGTIESGNTIKTQLTAAQAAQYLPVNFLSNTVPTQSYTGFTANWNPVTALANTVNNFAATGDVTLNSPGSSVTILGRPQTPGAGVIPTGTYQFLDGSNVIASGTLDASGEAYFTTSSLTSGTHSITMVYGGDANFNGSTSAPVTITVPGVPLKPTTTAIVVNNPSSSYGGTITGGVSVTPQSGTTTPTGTVTLYLGATSVGSCTLSSGSCNYVLSGVGAGTQGLTANYGGDTNYSASTSAAITISVARAILQVTANNYTIPVGGTLPTYAATITGFLNSDTQATAVTGAPALTGSAANSNTPGNYPITASTGTLAAANYNFTFTNGYLTVVPTSEAAPVATGDSRTVTEPQFPAVCQQLTATIAMVNNDIPASVDATVSNPDGARIQAALNYCSANYPGQAVELSVAGSGNNAFLSGPLTMPSNVTLLVDPAVVLFFSRNAQDYDKVPGTHTCGTINQASATSSCQSLIDIPGTSTNVGIMGYGKLDGRGGDPLLNAISPYQGYSWWGLSAAYSSPNSQQNPRFIVMEGGSSNITLYKITIRNSPLFHVSTTGWVSNVTIWDLKISTPTTSRNTDGIDGDYNNVTVTRSWVSDGDDNIAVGASGPYNQTGVGQNTASNISITDNRFFAGHGESIGSITEAGVNNVLFDGNMLAGNGFAGVGSSISTTGTFAGGVSDSNSTGIRIKSANDRGSVVSNIQYSNSCFLDHKSDVQFTPLYDTTAGTDTPNFENILMQNLVFLNDYQTTASAGTLQFTGANNQTPVPPVINPLTVTLDNVTFPSALSASSFTTTGTAGTETNAYLTYGPGQVSTNFVSAWASFVGVSSNDDTATDNRTATSLNPPMCSFTYIAPELTGPNGVPQTITQGQNASAIVILTPAVGGAAYPTGTVTLTDALTSTTYTATLPGNTDTLTIPLSGLSVGTHTFTATYAGDSNYVATGGAPYSTAGPYIVTVNPGSLNSTSTTVTVNPSTGSYGTPVTATATVTGSNPTGTVQFVVSGGGLTGSYTYATVALTGSGGTATASTALNLPMSATSYNVVASYSGDSVNAGSTSAPSQLTVGVALTTTTLSVNAATTTLGRPVLATVQLTSPGGVPTGTVSLSYTTATNNTPVSLGSATLSNGSVTFSVELPVGVDTLTAAYGAIGSFGASTSLPVPVTVSASTPIQLSASPIGLGYTMTTIAGGSSATVPSSGNMACTGATDKYGDGCLGTAMSFTSGDDLRGVAADPFGNVYITDASASLIRRISPNGVISNFAGRVTGTACTAPASTSANGSGCTPTLTSINKARGVSSDAAGNIFIAEYSGNKVDEVRAADGLMYTVAGTGTATSIGDGGPAVSATVDAPRSAYGDALGNIYIADTSANRIRVVDTAGNIHAFAGTGTNSSTGDGGPALLATISNPQGVLVDPNLNVYIADSSSIRVVCVTCGTNSPLDALLAKLGIASPVNGNIYTVAGGGTGTPTSAFLPVAATSVKMTPQKLDIDRDGNIYISDGNKGVEAIWFLDAHSGSIRALAADVSTVCSAATNSLGDGCPATQANFGSNGGNGMGTAVDLYGNFYISDSTNQRIRKVTSGLASPPTAVKSTATQPVQLHFITGDSLASTNGLVENSNEWSLATPSCTTNSDTTTDCLVSSSFTPAVPGARSTPLAVTSALGNSAYLALMGTGLGAEATLDPASQSSFGSNLQVAGLALDAAGNVYVSDSTSKNLLRFAASSISQGSSATGTALATLTAPGAAAVDQRGYVYVADTSSGTITQISPTGTATTLPLTFTAPSGLAVDAQDNLYVSDSSTKAVYQISAITGVERQLPVGTLAAPAGLSIDPSGNLLIADPGAPAVYRFNLQSNTRTTVSTTAAQPSAVVTDAAGNLLIADTASLLAVPASSNSGQFTVASLTPAALAIDASGNLYTGSGGSVLELERTQGYVQFVGPSAPARTVSLLDSGNLALNLASINQTDTSDYSLSTTTSSDCTVNASGSGSLAIGGVCSISAGYTPTTYLTTTDTATFAGNQAVTPVQLVLTGPATAPAATITLGAISPASPVYGQSVTIAATVTGASLSPTGSVVFQVDSNSVAGALANGVWTATLTSLTTGSHTFSATYTSTDGYTSATSSTSTFNVGQATPTITWPSPAAITYGTALGSAQLDATSTVAGTFSYSPAAGTVLGTGKQTLTATFTPTDATDYTSATQTVQLTVTQATPVITWPPPAAITYGTALSSAQLDATSTVAGTFAYNPPSGTVLSAGTQTLSVTFTPNDATDYTTASATVSLLVNAPSAPSATLSATSLTFAAQNTGSTSSAQTVTLTNSGMTALSITSIAASGDFKETNNCGSSLAASSNCTISVTFTPTAGGSRTGSLTITDNASGSPQTVALTGTGSTVSVSSSSTSLTISSPGGSATANVQLSALGGFSGTVSLTCVVTYQGTVIPTGVGAATDSPICGLNPTQQLVSGTGSFSSTLTVSTVAASAARLENRPLLPIGGGVLAALLIFAGVPRKRLRGLGLLAVLALVTIGGAIGCSGSSSKQQQQNPGTPTGNYSVTVTATSGTVTANLTIPLSVQ